MDLRKSIQATVMNDIDTACKTMLNDKSGGKAVNVWF
jgi:hypothetical protein